MGTQMRWLATSLTALVFMLATSFISAQAAGPYQSFQSGNWSGGAYTDDKTRTFTHCSASTTYRSNILFLVAVTRDMRWNLGFLHPQWKLTAGEMIPVTLIFDGKSKIDLPAKAVSEILALIGMPDNSELISAFRRSFTLEAFAKGDQFQFRLDGTSRLLPILVDCVRRNLPATGPQAAAPLGNAPSETSSSSKDYQELSQAEATVILTNLLNSAGVSGYRLEPPTQSSLGASFSLNDGTRGLFLGARKAPTNTQPT